MASGKKKQLGNADSSHSSIDSRMVNFWGEIYPVMAGLRPGAILEVPVQDKDLHAEYFARKGVCFRVLTQKQFQQMRIAADCRPSHDRKQGAVIFYISLNENTLRQIMDCDAADQSAELGALLGYPPCCIRKFQERKPGRVPKPVDRGSFKFIPHQPCSPDCMSSLILEHKLATAALRGTDRVAESDGKQQARKNAIHAQPKSSSNKERFS